MRFVFLILQLLFVFLTHNFIETTLLFPASSVLQITAALSVPIELPGRKLFWDWGLQMNYDLPFNLTQFFNAPIWPGKFGDRKRRAVDEMNNGTFWTEADLKYKSGDIQIGKHPSDFTAGELYHSFENVLVSYGFHETCLMKSVCELAYHPFADDEKNILTEILTFILTPSIHEAFSPSEVHYREVYEESERRGLLQQNCSDLFYECEQDALSLLTNVLTNVKRDDNKEN